MDDARLIDFHYFCMRAMYIRFINLIKEIFITNFVHI